MCAINPGLERARIGPMGLISFPTMVICDLDRLKEGETLLGFWGGRDSPLLPSIDINLDSISLSDLVRDTTEDASLVLVALAARLVDSGGRWSTLLDAQPILFHTGFF